MIAELIIFLDSKPTSKNSLRTSFQKHAVDHRPTRLLISGYEGDEQERVLAHFSVRFNNVYCK